MGKLAVYFANKRDMWIFLSRFIFSWESGVSKSHAPLDIRHSQGTKCLVRIERDELCKRQKGKWINGRHTQEGKSFNNNCLLEVVTLPQVIHGGKSVALNSVFLLSKEIPDPPQ